MTDTEAEEHRRNIERFKYLLAFVRDAEMRAHLEQLLDEAQRRLADLEDRKKS